MFCFILGLKIWPQKSHKKSRVSDTKQYPFQVPQKCNEREKDDSVHVHVGLR